MSDREPLDAFLDKWRARWPEWAVAHVFLPAGQRESVLAWWALVQELTDAAWGGDDRRPGEAKLGWWTEELVGWARGIRRHPLGQVLQRQAAPWAGLATSLPELIDSRERPLDGLQARAQLAAFAGAVAGVEQALFAPVVPAGSSDNGSAAAAIDTVVESLLHLRLAHHPADAIPLQELARGAEVAGVAWAGQVAVSPIVATRPRRILASLAKARLARGEPGQPVPALATLWVAWRAARG